MYKNGDLKHIGCERRNKKDAFDVFNSTRAYSQFFKDGEGQDVCPDDATYLPMLLKECDKAFGQKITTTNERQLHQMSQRGGRRV